MRARRALPTFRASAVTRPLPPVRCCRLLERISCATAHTASWLPPSVAAGSACFFAAALRAFAFGQCDLYEAVTVASAVFFVILLASLLAPLLTFALHARGMAAQGAPPSLAVLVDLLGTSITCMFIKRLLWA